MAVVGMIISIFLLILVLFVGSKAKGATRWISFAGLTIQPSEFAKYAIGFFFLATIGLLAWLGFLLTLSDSYWVTLTLAALLWLWQSLWLIHPLPRITYGKFFSQNVLVGFILLAGMISGCLR